MCWTRASQDLRRLRGGADRDGRRRQPCSPVGGVPPKIAVFEHAPFAAEVQRSQPSFSSERRPERNPRSTHCASCTRSAFSTSARAITVSVGSLTCRKRRKRPRALGLSKTSLFSPDLQRSKKIRACSRSKLPLIPDSALRALRSRPLAAPVWEARSLSLQVARRGSGSKRPQAEQQSAELSKL